MTTTAASSKVSRAAEGAEFEINGDAQTVQAGCAANSGYWACATHRETFQHNWAKDSHVSSGRHVLVWMCLEHGAEVP